MFINIDTPKKNRTLVTFVIDKSGSMEEIRSKIVSGFNEYCDELKKSEDSENMDITLIQFDEKVKTVFGDRNVSSLSPLKLEDYHPCGSTALFDAVGKAISAAEEKSSNYSNFLFFILTDGEENSSRIYTRDQIKSMINNHSSWVFTFLGSDPNSWDADASRINISRNNYVTWDSQNILRTFQSAAFGTTAYVQTANLNQGAVDTASFGSTYMQQPTVSGQVADETKTPTVSTT